jgi:hypothetical protein
LSDGVGADMVAAFSVAHLSRRRRKLLTPLNKVAMARLPGPLSPLRRGSYVASCHFDGQFMQEMPVSYLVTADVGVTFWDERAGRRQSAAPEQILNAQVHWMVLRDWQDVPADYYGAAPMRVAALFPPLRWEVKYDAGDAVETADAGMKEAQ